MDEDKIVMMSTKGYSQLVPTAEADGKNLYWTTDIDSELPIKIRQYGSGSETPVSLP